MTLAGGPRESTLQRKARNMVAGCNRITVFIFRVHLVRNEYKSPLGSPRNLFPIGSRALRSRIPNSCRNYDKVHARDTGLSAKFLRIPSYFLSISLYSDIPVSNRERSSALHFERRTLASPLGRLSNDTVSPVPRP